MHNANTLAMPPAQAGTKKKPFLNDDEKKGPNVPRPNICPIIVKGVVRERHPPLLAVDQRCRGGGWVQP